MTELVDEKVLKLFVLLKKLVKLFVAFFLVNPSMTLTITKCDANYRPPTSNGFIYDQLTTLPLNFVKTARVAFA